MEDEFDLGDFHVIFGPEKTGILGLPDGEDGERVLAKWRRILGVPEDAERIDFYGTTLTPPESD